MNEEHGMGMAITMPTMYDLLKVTGVTKEKPND